MPSSLDRRKQISGLALGAEIQLAALGVGHVWVKMGMKPYVLCICPSQARAEVWVAAGCQWKEMTGLWG